MPHPIWAALPSAVAGALVVLAAVSFGSGTVSSAVTAATTYPCSHVGGGVWDETWNNSSGTGPTHVFVPLPGHWWAEYNNTTGAAGDPGWGTLGTGSPEVGPGWTEVNITNESTVAAEMTTFACANPNTILPWHYDFATRLFVRNP